MSKKIGGNSMKIVTIIASILIVILIVLNLVSIFSNTDNNKEEKKDVDIENKTENNDVEELVIETKKEGEGELEAQAGDVITVHYTGTLLNGDEFDSSYNRDEPFSFTLGTGQVIQGWEEGLLGMKEGEEREITIPSHMGYGEIGAGANIPPNSGLIFYVELIGIEREND